uniref:peroxisomal membrane protein PMP34 n=1 Tax=Myxine glutinosa TaxID=7769 RepID=UPI00358F6EBA
METKLSFLLPENVVHAVAGAMGSAVAMTVFYPLDTARLRLQVDDKRVSKFTPGIVAEILDEEGLEGLYRGWFPAICSLFCSNFVYFYTFNGLKELWLGKQGISTPGKDIVMGLIAGTVNVLLTTPMWVVNTRLKLQGARFRNTEIKPTTYTGISDAFRRIVGDEGLGALWNGTLPSLLLVFNPAIQFMVYEGLKRKLGKEMDEFTSVDILIIGALAKAVATTTTYPLQTVQSTLRYGQHGTDRKRGVMRSLKQMVSLLAQRVHHMGPGALYRGLEAKLLQTVLTATLMFLLYEKITAFTFRIMDTACRSHRK